MGPPRAVSQFPSTEPMACIQIQASRDSPRAHRRGAASRWAAERLCATPAAPLGRRRSSSFNLHRRTANDSANQKTAHLPPAHLPTCPPGTDRLRGDRIRRRGRESSSADGCPDRARVDRKRLPTPASGAVARDGFLSRRRASAHASFAQMLHKTACKVKSRNEQSARWETRRRGRESFSANVRPDK